MDFELANNRGRTPPGMALAAAAIVAAGVTGMAVAGLTWALDRPAGTPHDVAAVGPTPSPSATSPIDTPGWAEALGLPAPAPVTSGGDAVPVDGVGPAARPVVPGTEEATRRAAAARRPVAGPTASAVRLTPTATNAAAAPAPAPTSASSSAASDPGAADPGAADPGGAGDPGASDPGAADPGAGDPGVLDPGLADPGADDPTATETTAPDTDRRNWEAPRRQWRDQPRQQPADPAPWNGPFGDFPRLFPWG
ncbi:hypothetical protein [Virgisporangium aurantiacum]|uniref:Uncharacterized protein n=1 Tax=Virgisporangium aurantiacum TaxID=175570 RepID=A0A8J4E465_9ACTN|nr:hypothetical protein [Virgisporangium aurantiacum]GIJ61645.1 hypothetical protein Vau01_091610 [Virgisporangium aurantiacum]